MVRYLAWPDLYFIFNLLALTNHSPSKGIPGNPRPKIASSPAKKVLHTARLFEIQEKEKKIIKSAGRYFFSHFVLLFVPSIFL
jgi:hypothetical protein